MASRCKAGGCVGNLVATTREEPHVAYNVECTPLPVSSQVAVWQSPAFPTLVVFLPGKVRSSLPRAGVTAILYCNAVARLKYASQSHLVMDSFCHCGLIQMLF